MKLQQVSESCFAVLNERHRACDANSGFIDRGGGVVIDTQADLSRARRMIELFARVRPSMPKRVINTGADGDLVSGNQLFAGGEIIAHRSVPDRMQPGASPRQLRQDCDVDEIEPALPTTLFDDRYVLDLDGTEVHLVHVGPCHRVGDTIVHVPAEGVVFAGNAVFRECTPMGWAGGHDRWLQCLDLIVWLDPDVIVPGHGPLCGIEGAMEMKAYLEYVYEESRRCFGQGLDALDAAKRIELGPYREWRCPARLYANVECAYRELRNESAPAPTDAMGTFDAMCEVARARGIEAEF